MGCRILNMLTKSATGQPITTYFNMVTHPRRAGEKDGLESMRLGLDRAGALTSACSLSGACGQVCPVQIPLPKLINRLRAESVSHQHHGVVKGEGSLRKRIEVSAWRAWEAIYTRPALYRLFSWGVTRLRRVTPSRIGGWSRYRTVPKPASQSLAELAE